MISTIVKLLLAFPRLGALFFKVHKEYEKKLSTDRYIEHRNRINDWMREPSSDKDTGVSPRIATPRFFRE
mgnify:FL=1|jgi:hypothetical protein|tara:strand:- start:9055 stop:9264 length:210 start_codon:yes stop_codon:yes gene_type:complete